jgi:hypothetical protein
MNVVTFLLGAVLLAFASIELVLRWLDVADPPTFQFNLLFGYLMHPDQSASTRGHRFRINNAGLRGADINSRMVGERRVVFVGDSITYGGGRIPDDDLFATRVAEALSVMRDERVTAVNVSAPGWGIQNMAAYIGANGVFEAEVVVWVLPSTDFRRHKTSLEDFAYPRTRPRSRLIYAALSWLSTVSNQGRPPTEAEYSTVPGADILEANLRALDSTLLTLRTAGIQLVVAVLPDEAGYRNLANDVQRFKAVADANGAVFVDLEPVFRMQQDLHLFEDGVHLTSRGHEFVANAILSTVNAAFAGGHVTSWCSSSPSRRA